MSDNDNNDKFATRHSLLERVRDKDDQNAWKEFVDYYDQFIYIVLRRFNLNPTDAEELTQDIVIQLWKILPDFQYNKSRGKFRTWLATIIRNAARSSFKKDTRRKELLKDNGDYIIDQLLDSESDSSVEKVIEDEWFKYISEKSWEIIEKRFQGAAQRVFILFNEGKTAEEIATICDMKIRTVHTYRFRMKKCLEEEIMNISEKFTGSKSIE